MDDQNQVKADPAQNPSGINQPEARFDLSETRQVNSVLPVVKREQELGLTSTAFQEAPIKEVPLEIQPSGEHAEPKIAPEVSQAGVEKVSPPTISPQAKQVGVQPAKESVRPEDLSGNVQLPTVEEARKEIKGKNPSDSPYWDGYEMLKAIKRFFFKEKNKE